MAAEAVILCVARYTRLQTLARSLRVVGGEILHRIVEAVASYTVLGREPCTLMTIDAERAGIMAVSASNSPAVRPGRVPAQEIRRMIRWRARRRAGTVTLQTIGPNVAVRT